MPLQEAFGQIRPIRLSFCDRFIWRDISPDVLLILQQGGRAERRLVGLLPESLAVLRPCKVLGLPYARDDF